MRKQFLIAFALIALPFFQACTNQLRPEEVKSTLVFDTSLSEFGVGAATKSAPGPTIVLGEGQLESPLYMMSSSTPWEDEVETKSAPVTELPAKFDVFGYEYISPWSTAIATATPALIYKETITKGNPSKEFWPNEPSHKVRFFSVAPNGGYTASPETATGFPVLTYTVDDNVADQTDILAAASAEYVSDARVTVPLKFYHALAGVRFLSTNSKVPGTVKSIKIAGAYKTASLSWEDDGAIGPLTGSPATGTKVIWSNHSENSSDYNITPGTILDGITPDIELNPDATTILCIPQTLPAGAYAQIVYTVNGADYTFTANLQGHVWQPGVITTYAFTINPDGWASDKFTAPSEIVFDNNVSGNQTKDLPIQAHSRHNSGITLPLAWTITYSTDGGSSYSSSRPEWLTLSPDSDSGTGDATITCTSTANSGVARSCKIKITCNGAEKIVNVISQGT